MNKENYQEVGLSNSNRFHYPVHLLVFGALLISNAGLFAQAGGSGPGPGASDPLRSNSQRNGGVSTTTVPQVEPLSPFLKRPEQVIEHDAPVQPPQPRLIPRIRPQAVEDDAAVLERETTSRHLLLPNTPGLSQNFQGISATGWIPPDPCIATGPSHLIVATNSSFAIYTKAGVRQFFTTFGAWFAALNPPNAIFDPRVVYDANAGRWILLLLAKDDATQRSQYLISVSENSDPNGRWWSWLLDATLNGTTASGLWADFEGLGYDSGQAVYLTSNQYTFGNNLFQVLKGSDSVQVSALLGGERWFTWVVRFLEPAGRGWRHLVYAQTGAGGELVKWSLFCEHAAGRRKRCDTLAPNESAYHSQFG